MACMRHTAILPLLRISVNSGRWWREKSIHKKKKRWEKRINPLHMQSLKADALRKEGRKGRTGKKMDSSVIVKTPRKGTRN